MEKIHVLPFVVALDDADDPADVLDALALGPFTAGLEPAAHTRRLNRLRSDALLLPPGVRPSWTARDHGRRAHLAQGEGWTLRAVRWADDSAQITVTAITDTVALHVLEAATLDAEEVTEDDGHVVVAGFWHLRRCDGRAHRDERTVTIETWEAIRPNYERTAAVALDKVMNLDPGALRARLVLLHGPPGTGKTTVLRALAHAWREWCCLEVVLDPEQLLGDAGYLSQVLVAEDDERPGTWRLVVLEDCDELIRADAKRGAGQSLARLLNLTDGLLGQGRKLLIAITTNEPLQQLHPAIVRPGRCLAEIAIGPLPRAEARRWLRRPHPIPAEGATLAQLYALRGQLDKIEQPSVPESVGQYL
jgi:hypothetical protein